MSIFSKIWKGVIRPVAKAVIPGYAAADAAFSAMTKSSAPAAIPRLPGPTRTVPGGSGLGALGGAVGGYALGKLGQPTLPGGAAASPMGAGDPYYNGQAYAKRKRRRRRGITATELKNYERVANFLDKKFKCTKSTRIARR